ncbi:hypothetical protein BH11PLA2_BH11PLA2_30490 [soil metagenome]
MTFARVRLIVALALFLGWLAWLGWAVSQKGTVQIVSRAQLAAATHWVIVEVKAGEDGIPNSKVNVKQVVFGDPITGEIEVKNLPSSATPVPVKGDSRTPPPGEYLVALVKITDGLYRIAGLPRSPGYEAQFPERAVIYPWTDDVKKQIESFK